MEPVPFPCHPARTRISYLTALTDATYVVLPKENHKQLAEATSLDRKSGGVEGSAVPRTSPGNEEYDTQPTTRSRAAASAKARKSRSLVMSETLASIQL
jgi:hypothetical protein